MKLEPDRGGRGSLHFRSDGLLLSPLDYANLLVELGQTHAVASDNYSAGGVVTELENRFAEELGKERALFLPTGTLANHLAIRQIAQGKRRVLVQAESHLYNDAVDGLQALSGLNLVPLGVGQATVTLADFEVAFERASGRPHPVSVGAISIESPVRRRHGEVFDFDEMERIARFARVHGIKLHLDGARLFIASAYTGIAPAKYAALFDTVYVSLYKCFNAGSGAILAGPADVIALAAADRRLFGADLYRAWPDAAVALHYLDGFQERFGRAAAAARQLFTKLNEHPQLRIEPVPHGTNVFKLHLTKANPDQYAAALASAGIIVRTQSAEERFQGVWLVVNESINFNAPDQLASVFIQALPA